jgi:hypothetical protein
MDVRAEGVRVAYPLFHAGGGGSTPTSALQFQIIGCPIEQAVALNRRWHSRLPILRNYQACEAFAAEFEGLYYAVAIWSHPVARMLNGKGMWELRRMAIAPDAPKNTASRMLGVMALLIRRSKPDVQTLISYQDMEVHAGTIYKAAGWAKAVLSGGGEWARPSRYRPRVQSGAQKQRWEKSLIAESGRCVN